MRNRLFQLLFLALVSFFASCASVTKVKVNYFTPGDDGIALASGASFKVVASENSLAQKVKAGIEASFAQVAKRNDNAALQESEVSGKGKDLLALKAADRNAQLKISDIEPDYWMFVTVTSGRRVDSSDEVEFNFHWEKDRDEAEYGGEEKLQWIEGGVTSSDAAVVNIAIYSRHGLLPIHEFGFATWNSESIDSFQQKVVSQVIERVNKGLQTMSRSVDTLIPKCVADSPLAKAIIKGNHARAKACLADLKLKSFEDFLAELDAVAAQNDSSKLKAMTAAMSNYYLAALETESNHLDTHSLRRIHGFYLALLKNSQDAGLSLACADSLARVEKKLAQLASVKK